MTRKLSTRGIETAEYIGLRLAFTTHGALRAETGRPPAWSGYGGRLNPAELAQWKADRETITYTVYSYDTPIAWVTQSGRVHKVNQRFSVTTTKHQSNLYQLKEWTDAR